MVSLQGVLRCNNLLTNYIMKHRFLFALAVLGCLLTSGASAYAQSKVTVSGTVTEAQTNEPVIGAVVMVKGSSEAALADEEGRYTIEVNADAVLIANCLGYADKEEAVNGRTTINFSLAVDNQMLEETVVVGYGTLKKSQLVGSVESVTGEVLEDRVTSDVTRSLQGQVPGLNIIQTDGKPTHGGKIYVRGGATSYISRGATGGSKASYSIGQGGSALVLIDGVEGELSQVNPEDVESVSVLKDASSSVIYGAKAAYGVILVTTKNAKSEKVSISYNGSYTINQRTVRWEDNVITDGLTYVETFYEHYMGQTATPKKEGDLPTKINTYLIPSNYLDLYREHIANGGGKKTEVINGSYVYFGYNENYLEKFYKPTNSTQTHNISISGSSDKVSYNVSGRYYSQEGIYKIGNENYDAFNLRSKINVKVNDWLSFDNNTSMYKMDYTQPFFSKGNSGGIGNQIWQIAVAGFPVIPTHNDDGTYTIGAVPGGYAAFADGNSGQVDDHFTFTTVLGLTIEPIKDVLKVRGDVSYKWANTNRDRFVAPTSYSKGPGNVTAYATQADSYLRETVYNKRHLTANVVATWTPKLGENHQLNVVGGWNLEDYNYGARETLRLGRLYPEKTNFELMDGEEVTLTDEGNSYAQVGFFGRANYSLLNRYIFEVSARYDGSSRFPIHQQWGFFPSASLGWRISEEPWMEAAKSSWLDNLKFRANAGSLGNGTVAPFTFMTLMGVTKTGKVFDGGFVPKVDDPAVVPDNLTWETVTTYDVGLDMDVLKNRLSFSADYYVRNTDNLYVAGPEIPASFGAATPKGNYGALQTRGWEVTLAWKDQFKLGGKDFRYNIKASLWDSRTWVTKYYNQSGGMFNLYEGKELGELWGFRTDGYFMSNEEATAYNAAIPNQFHNYYPSSAPYAGDIKFVDVNGDKKIDTGSWTVDDHGDLERIGNEAPRYQFGLNLDFRWNGFGLSAFFQGVGQRDYYASQGSDFFWGNYARSYCFVLKDQVGNKVILDKSTENWTVTNPGAYWPRPTQNTANNAKGALTFPNDYFLLNAAYVRLKNLTLDYTFSGNWLKKANIQKLRIYLTGENLFTWSPMFKYTSMLDPEVIGSGDSDYTSGTNTSVGDGYSYPMLRTFTVGINITL